MNWLKVDVIVSTEAAEIAGEVLMQLTPSGIQIDDREGISVLTAYAPESFPTNEIRALVRSAIDAARAQGLQVEPAQVEIDSITDENWAENYKEFFHPLRIGKLLIKPSWESVETNPGDTVIQLDPGLAFGTGSHATTEGCLLFLQEALNGGEMVFDIGTGSGILSIAAAKLGASRVVAIDNDGVAIDVAQDNARINGVADKIEFKVLGFADVEPTHADVVVANITGPLVIAFLPEIVNKFPGVKVLITSGITAEQKDGVLTALSDYSFVVDDVFEKNAWVTVVSRRG
ncbi:MAG TPA: 50S ribosomal protein L11 methyltransferase [Candidatus Aquicultor sp.]|jgi:ribosomal protein L11 methyltransferase